MCDVHVSYIPRANFLFISHSFCSRSEQEQRDETVWQASKRDSFYFVPRIDRGKFSGGVETVASMRVSHLALPNTCRYCE